jgi:hypothetical protein
MFLNAAIEWATFRLVIRKVVCSMISPRLAIPSGVFFVIFPDTTKHISRHCLETGHDLSHLS